MGVDASCLKLNRGRIRLLEPKGRPEHLRKSAGHVEFDCFQLHAPRINLVVCPDRARLSTCSIWDRAGLGAWLRRDAQVGCERPPALRKPPPCLIVGERRRDDHILPALPIGGGGDAVAVSQLKRVDRS